MSDLKPVTAGDTPVKPSGLYETFGGFIAAFRVEAVTVLGVGTAAFDREGRFVASGAAVDAGMAVLSLKVEGPGNKPGLPESLGMITHNIFFFPGLKTLLLVLL